SLDVLHDRSDRRGVDLLGPGLDVLKLFLDDSVELAPRLQCAAFDVALANGRRSVSFGLALGLLVFFRGHHAISLLAVASSGPTLFAKAHVFLAMFSAAPGSRSSLIAMSHTVMSIHSLLASGSSSSFSGGGGGTTLTFSSRSCLAALSLACCSM